MGINAKVIHMPNNLKENTFFVSKNVILGKEKTQAVKTRKVWNIVKKIQEAKIEEAKIEEVKIKKVEDGDKIIQEVDTRLVRVEVKRN